MSQKVGCMNVAEEDAVLRHTLFKAVFSVARGLRILSGRTTALT